MARTRKGGERWALIVGVSKYQHAAWSLEYAHSDAIAMRDFLSSPEGGAFNQIQPFIDEQATSAAVGAALRSFVQKAAEEDLLVLYFAGHGLPDPDAPDNSYFLTHDSQPDNIAGTALPMYAIEDSLRRHVRAKKVVIFVDTCHSARIHDRRGAGDHATVVNRFLEEMARAKPGVASLSSAAANQSAIEDAKLGSGVFTHFLLRGLKGEADGYGGGPKDGRIGARELFEFVRDHVKAATGNTQHPTIGTGEFDPELTLAVVGRSNVEAWTARGKHLARLAAELGDDHTYALSNLALDEALALAAHTGLPQRDAELTRAYNEHVAGSPAEARRMVAAIADPSTWPEDAWVLLAMSTVATEPPLVARDVVRRASRLAPSHPWLAEYADWLDRTETARLRAVLIGVNQYEGDWTPLAGCINDATSLHDALRARLGAVDADVQVLPDPSAADVEQALDELAARSTPQDQVIVSFSGHGYTLREDGWNEDGRAVEEAPFLVCRDHVTVGSAAGSMSSGELHRRLSRIPSTRTLLVLDTHPSVPLYRLAREDGRYMIFVAADVHESAVEVVHEGRPRGAFTAALSEALMAAPDVRALSLGDLVARTIAWLRDRGQAQTPMLIGDPGEMLVFDDPFRRLHALSVRRNFAHLDARRLAWRRASIEQRVTTAFPEAWLAIGRAAAALGQRTFAADAFERAGSGEAFLELAQLHVRARAYEHAASAIERAGGPAEVATLLRTLVPQPLQLLYLSPPGRTDAGVPAAVDELRLALAAEGAYEVPFDQLAAHQDVFEPDRPTLVVYLGPGLVDEATARLGSRLASVAVGDVAAWIGDRPDVTVALDVDWNSPSGHQVAPPELPLLGARLLVPPPGLVRGTFFHALAQAGPSEPDDLTYAEWMGRAQRAREVATRWPLRGRDAPVFGNARAWAAVRGVALRWLDETIDDLRRLNSTEEGGAGWNASELALGIALAHRGDVDEALRELYEATAHLDGEALEALARFHYGRVLYLEGDDPSEAVSELNDVIEFEPDHGAAYFYLAMASRAQLERQTSATLAHALRTYLALGAPCGHEEEVRRWLAGQGSTR